MENNSDLNSGENQGQSLQPEEFKYPSNLESTPEQNAAAATTEDLQAYLERCKNPLPEHVQAALAELTKRCVEHKTPSPEEKIEEIANENLAPNENLGLEKVESPEAKEEKPVFSKEVSITEKQHYERIITANKQAIEKLREECFNRDEIIKERDATIVELTEKLEAATSEDAAKK